MEGGIGRRNEGACIKHKSKVREAATPQGKAEGAKKKKRKTRDEGRGTRTHKHQDLYMKDKKGHKGTTKREAQNKGMSQHAGGMKTQDVDSSHGGIHHNPKRRTR